MLYCFWGISLFYVIAFALKNRNTTYARKICLFWIFIFMWVLLGWSSGAYDVEIGISRYNNYQYYKSFTEVGYTFLISLCHNIGMNYRFFFVMCAFFELVVMFWFAEKNCTKSPIVFGLFMIFPLVIYFQYVRNILAFSFVLIAIDSLINKSKKYIFKYIFFVMIGTIIHSSSLFFLLYLPLKFYKKKITAIFTAVVFVLLYLSKGIDLFSNGLTKLVGETKAEIILGTTGYTGMFGRVSAVAFTILTFFTIYMILKYLYRIPMDDEESDLFAKINILSLLFIPLTINFGSGFARIPTLLMLPNYIFLVNRISLIKGQKRRIIVYTILTIFLIVLLIIKIRNIEYRELVLYPFFEENELIAWLFS